MTTVWAIRDANAPKGTRARFPPTLCFSSSPPPRALISLCLRVSVSTVLGVKLLGYLGWSGEEG